MRGQVFRREGAQQEVLVEMDFTWAGNQKFQLQVGIGHLWFML